MPLINIVKMYIRTAIYLKKIEIKNMMCVIKLRKI